MIDSARQQWEEGVRRLEAEAGDPVRYRQLCYLVDFVVDELRRRLGQHYTLAELAALHSGGEDWARSLIADVLPSESQVGVRDGALVVDAAFHAYTRGASDYRP